MTEDITNEESFVEFLRERTGGDNSLIGDDCAIIDAVTPALLVTVDTMVSDVHFTPEATSDQLAKKVLGINRSDLAAMGGRPRWALFSSVDAGSASRQVELCEALIERLNDDDIKLAGGDLSSTADGSVLSLTLLGEPTDERVLRRDAASPGDLILVSGSLGGVRAVLDSRGETSPRTDKILYEPPNRLDLGEAAIRAGVRSAIDLSDGLLKDLRRVLAASGVGAKLDYREIPIHDVAIDRADSRDQALQWALEGGEDYELLLAVPPDRVDQLKNAYPLSVVGEFVGETGVRWSPDLPGGIRDEKIGYDHFS